VYLGRHEARLRDEIQHLAAWPATVGDEVADEIKRVIDHGVGILAARRIVVIWEPDQEPRVQLAVWTPDSFEIARHASPEFEPWVADELADASFLWPPSPAAPFTVITRRARFTPVCPRPPVNPPRSELPGGPAVG